MKHPAVMKIAPIVLILLLTAACSGADAGKNAQTMAAENGAPSAATVASAQAATGMDNGGHMTAQISGAKTASADIHDAGFCVTSAAIGKDTMHIFSLGANDASWSVTITGMEGTPTLGAHKIVAQGTSGYSAGVSDKTTGKEPATWQRYAASSGSVTFTSVSASKVEGSYTLQAAPEGPQTTGPPVDVTGTFSAPVTKGC